MKEIDGNDVNQNKCFEADLCIVGGGAAGIAIAKSFIGTKVKVLVIESGSHSFNNETQSLYDFENAGHNIRAQEGYISRNRYLGGSTNTWHGGCAPLSDIDFEKREWIPNSGWPINRDDLIPFYREASEFLKIPSFNYFENNEWRSKIRKSTSKYLDGKKLSPALFLFANRPTNTRLDYSSDLQSSPNVQVILNSNVVEIEPDQQQSTVEKLHIATVHGNHFFIKAKQYVLACGGWENARLLLLSKRYSESGLGNSNDVVGRYYNEHPKIVSGKLIPTSPFLRSPIMIWKRRITRKGFMRVSLKLTSEVQRKYGLCNHYVQPIYPQSVREAITNSDSFVNNLDFSRATMHRLAKFSSSIFTLFDSFERVFFNLPLGYKHLGIVSHFEQLPNRESRVELSDEKDILGQNKLKVTLKITENEKESMIRYHEILSKTLQEEGIGSIQSEFPPADQEWPGLTDSSHHIGTTRMSDDPKMGVVNKDCQVHGISNLYIASSSVFPTGGHVNSTLSIVAIAFRVASHLKNRLSV